MIVKGEIIMCDSICIDFMVRGEPVDSDGLNALPFKRHLILDEQGEMKYSVKPPSYSVASPLTDAKFKILAFVNVTDGCPHVVSLNP